MTVPAAQARKPLEDLRHSLLQLHKALIEYERISFEKLHGRVASSGEMLQLVIHHEWFAWLRPLSELIVLMDEKLAAEEELSTAGYRELIEQARALLHPSESGAGFARQYDRALQTDPAVVLAHAAAVNLLA